MADYENSNGSPVVMQPQQPVAQSPHPRRQKPRRESTRSMASTLAVFILAPLFAFFLTAFVFQSYQVDGESMETTLQNNDRLLVWKVPRTWSRITNNPYIPKRGDVVIFVERNPSGYDQAMGKQLVKRVIALPGERVVVRDNQVTVYNKEHPSGFSPDNTLPYGNVIKDTNGEDDEVVPDGSVYVMGDNRGNSLDSRSFGPIPADDIVGKLIMRVWPINQAKTF